MHADLLPDQLVDLPGRISVPSLTDLTPDLSGPVRTGRRRVARAVPWMSSGPSTRTRVVVGAVAVLGAAAALAWWTRRNDTAGTDTDAVRPTSAPTKRAA